MIGAETARIWVATGIEVFAQSSLILIVALLASWVIRRRGPAAQALVLRATLVAVVASTVVSFAIPGKLPSVFHVSLPSLSAPTPSAPAPERAETSSAPTFGVVFPDEYANAPVLNRGPHEGQVPASVGNEDAPMAATRNTTPRTVRRDTPRTVRRDGLRIAYLAGVEVWAGGVLALLVWLLVCQANLTLIRLRCARVEEGPVFDALAQLSTQIGVRRPALYAGSAVKCPFLAGVAQPAIFLPAGFAERFEADTRVAVLAHELCHLRRGDAVWALVARLACCLLWPQPLIWLFARRLVDTAEAACDAEVLAQGLVAPSAYAGCLVDMADYLAMPRSARSVALGVAPFKSALGRRVERILSGAGNLIRPITPALRAMVALGGATVAIAGAFLISAHSSTPTAPMGQPESRSVRNSIGFLGFTYTPAGSMRSVPPAMGAPSEIERSGVIVVTVSPGSPAAEAGLQPGDLIEDADGQPLGGKADRFAEIISAHKQGDRMTLVTFSQGQERYVLITIAKPPAEKNAGTRLPRLPSNSYTQYPYGQPSGSPAGQSGALGNERKWHVINAGEGKQDASRTQGLDTAPDTKRVAADLARAPFYEAEARYDENLPSATAQVGRAIRRVRVPVSAVSMSATVAPDVKPLSSFSPANHYKLGERLRFVVNKSRARYRVAVTVGKAAKSAGAAPVKKKTPGHAVSPWVVPAPKGKTITDLWLRDMSAHEAVFAMKIAAMEDQKQRLRQQMAADRDDKQRIDIDQAELSALDQKIARYRALDRGQQRALSQLDRENRRVIIAPSAVHRP